MLPDRGETGESKAHLIRSGRACWFGRGCWLALVLFPKVNDVQLFTSRTFQSLALWLTDPFTAHLCLAVNAPGFNGEVGHILHFDYLSGFGCRFAHLITSFPLDDVEAF